MWGNLKRLGQVVAPPLSDEEEGEYEYDDDDDEEYDDDDEPQQQKSGLVGFLARALDQSIHTNDNDDDEEDEEEEEVDLQYTANTGMTNNQYSGQRQQQSLFDKNMDFIVQQSDHSHEPVRADSPPSPDDDTKFPVLRRESGSVSPQAYSSQVYNPANKTGQDVIDAPPPLIDYTDGISNASDHFHSQSEHTIDDSVDTTDSKPTGQAFRHVQRNIYNNVPGTADTTGNKQNQNYKLTRTDNQSTYQYANNNTHTTKATNNESAVTTTDSDPVTPPNTSEKTSVAEISDHGTDVNIPTYNAKIAGNPSNATTTHTEKAPYLPRRIPSSDEFDFDDDDDADAEINADPLPNDNDVETKQDNKSNGTKQVTSTVEVLDEMIQYEEKEESRRHVVSTVEIIDDTMQHEEKIKSDAITNNGNTHTDHIQVESIPELSNDNVLPVDFKASVTNDAPATSVPTNGAELKMKDEKIAALAQNCDVLQQQLQQAETRIIELQQQTRDRLEQEEHSRMTIKQKMQQKMSEWSDEKQLLLNELQKAREQALQAQQDTEVMTQHEHDAMQQLKRHERAMQMAEDKLAHTMAMVDEREEKIAILESKVEALQSSMKEHHHGAREAEQELDEIHAENESLHEHVEKLEAANKKMKSEMKSLKHDSEKLSSIKLEMQMLQESLEREKAKSKNMTESVQSSNTQLESERDEALAEIRELRRQVRATNADLEVARADTSRVMKANENLQSALEAFQSEREAELAMLDEQRRENEEAAARAQAAALDALNEVNEVRIREIQQASNDSVRQVRQEMEKLQAKLEKFRTENVQMRRSLDEAINRLQMNQEDVIDRALMKNILLDWLTKNAAKEKRQVLEIMASLLHFSDAEKERVHISGGGSAIGKVVGSVVSIPPTKTDVEHLEGDNVRDKWVNFLLAETDD